MKSIAAKFGAGVLTLALAFSVASPASAALSQTQTQAILDLLASFGADASTIANVNAALNGEATTGNGGSSSSDVCPFVWQRDLTTGATGADVLALQKFLNDNGFTIAVSGAGSAGMETSYYGSLTAQAVAKFQTAYAAEVLAPIGLSAGTGYFGALTRAKVNGMCVTPSDDDDDMDDDDDNNNDDDDELNGGEASLEDYDISGGDDDDVEEGDTGEIAEFEFDVENGDVRVNRVDVAFVNASGEGDTEPWDVFESVSLWMDGDEVASMDADDEDDWLNEDGETYNSSYKSYELRFNNLSEIVRENDKAEFTVAVTTQNNVDDVSASSDVNWTVYIPYEGIRATDSEGIQNYTGDSDSDTTGSAANDTVTFEIQVEGQGEELNVRSSSDDPDESILQVEDDEVSDWYTFFAFDLEAEDNDIEVEAIPVDVITSSASGTASLINDIMLVIDGEEYDDYEITNSSGSTDTNITYVFDTDGLVIDADEEITVEVVAEFEAANDTNYSQGSTVQGKVRSGDAGWDAEGADDVTPDGTVTGDTHIVLVSGIYSDSPAETDANGNTEAGGVGTFTFDVELTAFEQDAFLSTTSSAFDWTVVGGTATSTATVQSDADISSGYYQIDEGSTETFTVVVTVDPASSGSYYVILDAVDYADTADVEESQYELSPQSDYDTKAVSIAG